jgi:hypothetical protein
MGTLLRMSGQVPVPPPWSPSTGSRAWSLLSPPALPALASPGTSTKVAHGMGMCASLDLGLVAVSCREDCTVAFYALPSDQEGGSVTSPGVAATREPAPLLLLATIGTKGTRKMEFDFRTSGGWMCFTPRGTLLVVEGGNKRVQELHIDMSTGRAVPAVTHLRYHHAASTWVDGGNHGAVWYASPEMAACCSLLMLHRIVC